MSFLLHWAQSFRTLITVKKLPVMLVYNWSGFPWCTCKFSDLVYCNWAPIWHSLLPFAICVYCKIPIATWNNDNFQAGKKPRLKQKKIILNLDTLLICMKAAKWRFEAKKVWLPWCKMTWIFCVVWLIQRAHWRLPLTELVKFRFGAQLTSMGKEWFNLGLC